MIVFLRLTTFLTCLSTSLICFSQTVSLSPLYNSIGYAVALPEGYDADQTAHCFIKYRKSTETTFRDGMEADRVLIAGSSQFRGSLFLLNEGTLYDYQISLVDSFPAILFVSTPIFNISTLPAPVFTPTTQVKWVSPDGSGTLYTEAQPGKLKTLLASGTVLGGITIMMKDGIYSDTNMALTLETDCQASDPIVFLAAPGANPIFDGGYSAPLTWTPHASAPVTTFNSQAIGIKTNSGDGTPTINPANLYFFNNTFHSDDSLGFAYTLWGGEWKISI
jgi:hypothetical protein